MAHHKSTKKRIVLSLKENARNKVKRTRLTNALKSVTESTDKETITATLNSAVKTIDQMQSKGVLHKNNAANKKSRLAKHAQTVLSS